MQLATSSMEFSFNNNMYRQIDGVALGSPLGLALANIFVGHQEQKVFNVVNRPLAYFRYVDDTFAVFNNEDDCNAFLSHLNSLHPSLRFTHEKESNHSLPFLVCWLKDVTPNFQHQSTGNLPSLASIYAGIPSAPTNGKSI